jgi:FHA domain-containing protein/zinc ribbon protein
MKAREFRIRLLNHVYILPHGRVTIGRNPASHIHLEGDLVSRDHAHLLIEGEGVSIVDEASENGVFVNGVRVEGSRALVHGDLLRVAFYDLHLEEQEKSGSDAETIQMVFCTECGAVLTPEMRFCTQCGARTRRYSKTESCSSCCGHQLAKQDRRIRKEERLLAEFARRSGSKGDRDTER